MSRELRDEHVAVQFRAIVAEHSRQAASFYPATDQEPWSYGRLDATSEAFAQGLIGMGVNPGDAVALRFEASSSLVAAVIAVAKCGAHYVVIDPALPESRATSIIAEVRPTVAIENADSKLSGTWVSLDGVLTAAGRESLRAVPLDPKDLLYVCYTSGTTGEPKGVQIRSDSVSNLVHGTKALVIYPGDRVAQVSSPSFDAFTYELWGSLLSGATLVGLSKGVATDPASFARAVRENGLTVTFQSTALFNLIAEYNPSAYGRMRLVLFGGEVANVGRAKEVLTGGPARLVHCYGPTELTTFSLFHELERNDVENRELPIGQPLGGYVACLDRSESEESHTAGELLLGGPGLTAGYRDRPDLDAEKFKVIQGERYYRTGDFVRVDTNGLYWFVGRKDNQLKIRGHRVELEDVETQMRACPAIKEVAVVAHRDLDSTKLSAFVTRQAMGGAAAHLARWQELYDSLYRSLDGRRETDLFRGWNSTRSHQPLPLEEMRVWRETTVERLLESGPSRVLEIGVGTGLLLRRVVDHVEAYWGTDISDEVLVSLAASFEDDAISRDKIVLRNQGAHEMAGIPLAYFDLVVLNSVVQYFPSVEYFENVIVDALERLKPGGRLFLGDIRNADLALLSRHELQDESNAELLLGAGYLAEMSTRLASIGSLDIELKRGAHRNELNAFRFDVVIEKATDLKDQSSSEEDLARVDRPWSGETAAGLVALSNRDSPASLRYTGIPNSRLVGESDGISPEAIYLAAEKAGQPVIVTYSTDVQNMDVILYPRGSRRLRGDTARWRELASSDVGVINPDEPQNVVDDTEQIWSFMADRLPSYMIPLDITVLQELPLNSSGKVDRRILKELSAAGSSRGVVDPPRDLLELWVVEMLAGALGRSARNVAVHDNFFDIGGHSLTAARAAANLRELLGGDFSAPDLYRYNTPETIAREYRQPHGESHPVSVEPMAMLPTALQWETSFIYPDQGTQNRRSLSSSATSLARALEVVVELLGTDFFNLEFVVWTGLALELERIPVVLDAGADFAAILIDAVIDGLPAEPHSDARPALVHIELLSDLQPHPTLDALSPSIDAVLSLQVRDGAVRIAIRRPVLSREDLKSGSSTTSVDRSK